MATTQNNARSINKPKKLLGDGQTALSASADEEIEIIERKELSMGYRLFSIAFYLGFIGGLGMMLSIYHLFFWDSTKQEIVLNEEDD